MASYIRMIAVMACTVIAVLIPTASPAKPGGNLLTQRSPDLVLTTHIQVLEGKYNFLSGTSKRTVVNTMIAKTKRRHIEIMRATEYVRFAYKPSVPGGCGKPPCPPGSKLLWGHRWWTYTEGAGWKLSSMGSGSCNTEYCSEVGVKGLYSFDYFMQPHYESCLGIKYGPFCKHFDPVVGIVVNGDGTYSKYVR